ncbi:MAG: LysR family transcriptional regulator [Chloroflexota bacterium]|nr:LysR family transcriptional regulator [Chloroflexota bacterium]
MQLAQLQGLVEIARAGSIGRAAEQLFITQPALTARLKALEAELECQVVVRGRGGSRLTDAGRALLPYAERAIAAADEGAQRARELAGGRTDAIAIGAAPAVSAYVLPVVLRHLRATYPDARLSVRSGHSEELLELVLRGDVQVGVMRPLRHPEITTMPVYEDRLILVAHRGHRFTRLPHIRMRDLADEQLVMFDRASSYHDLTRVMFRTAGVQPRSFLEVDNIDAAKRMVQEELGVALLPQSAVAVELRDQRLRAVRVTDMTPVRRTIIAVRRRDAGPATGALARFLELLVALAPKKDRAAAAGKAGRPGRSNLT